MRAPPKVYQPWLHRFAVLTAMATLGLIGIGGVVTSHEAGLAVPDWPTSNGYNMFLFPISQWWHAGNIFYEHSHRLFASGVGLLTTILAVWLWRKEPRGWVRWLGVAAFFAVVLQGVLGGLRVVWLKDQIGIFHAALAQLFFVLTCAIALFTSRWWMARESSPLTPLLSDGRGEQQAGACRRTRFLVQATTILIFFQLILGATMRHQHAGLAIPDFPLAYGKLWPAMDAASVAQYNQQRDDVTSLNPITAFQIGLQMTHRIVAVLILAAVAFCAWKVAQTSKSAVSQVSKPASPSTAEAQPIWKSATQQVWKPALQARRLAFFWLGLVLAQAGLGAATVLSHKAADVATAHVLAGALSLATGAVLCIIFFRSPELARRPVSFEAGVPAADGNSLAARTATT